MVREAGDRDLEPPKPDDALHHADLKPRLLEQTALLDVQLDVAGEVPRLQDRLTQTRDISTDQSDAFANRLPRPRDLVEIRRRDGAGGALAADRPAFLVRPDDDIQRMTQAYALLAQRSCDLDCAERPDGSIEVAAIGDRIDVRTDEDRAERAVGPIE